MLGVLGVAGVAGWVLDVRWLRGPVPGEVDMKFNTALGLVLAGCSLGLAAAGPAKGPRLVAAVLCGAGLVAVGATTLLEYLLRSDLGIDQLFVADVTRAHHTVDPGRPAPQTAAAFVVGGLGLLAVHGRSTARAVDACGAAIGVAGVFSVIGYAYGTPALSRLPGLTPIAPHTAVALLALSAGLLAVAQPGRLAGRLSGPTDGSVAARRALPLAALGIPLLGWLCLEGIRHDLFPAAVGMSLLAVAALALVATGILTIAGLLNRAERARAIAAASDQRFAAVVDAANEPIVSADENLRITSWNAAAERLLGYTPDEIIGQPVSVLIPEERRAEAEALIRSVLHEGSAASSDTQRRHRDGTLVELAVSVSAIRLDDRVIGTCAVYHDIAARKAAHAALEAQVRHRTAELAASRAETLQRLAFAAEYRDDDTYHHTERVGHVSALLARRLGLPPEEVALIRQAAPLHDVGKLAIPDAVLLKPGSLTDAEFDVIRSHTVVGARILRGSGSDVLQLAERIALYHHERWDGGGYPMGLGGEDVPLAARIVAVADVYDALTHDRPYKQAWTHDEARAEIARVAGTQFDPAVAAAFLALEERELLDVGVEVATQPDWHAEPEPHPPGSEPRFEHRQEIRD